MAVTDMHRKRRTYDLHADTTNTGKPRYWFSMEDGEPLVDSTPKGYEVYEMPTPRCSTARLAPNS